MVRERSEIWTSYIHDATESCCKTICLIISKFQFLSNPQTVREMDTTQKWHDSEKSQPAFQSCLTDFFVAQKDNTLKKSVLSTKRLFG